MIDLVAPQSETPGKASSRFRRVVRLSFFLGYVTPVPRASSHVILFSRQVPAYFNAIKPPSFNLSEIPVTDGVRKLAFCVPRADTAVKIPSTGGGMRASTAK